MFSTLTLGEWQQILSGQIYSYKESFNVVFVVQTDERPFLAITKLVFVGSNPKGDKVSFDPSYNKWSVGKGIILIGWPSTH